MPRNRPVIIVLLAAFGCSPGPGGTSSVDFTASLSASSSASSSAASDTSDENTVTTTTTSGTSQGPGGTDGGSGMQSPDLPDPCADFWACMSSVSLDTISCEIECETAWPGADENSDCEFAACLSECEEVRIEGEGACAESWPLCSDYEPDPENCTLVCQQDMTDCLLYPPLCNENNPPYTGPCGLTHQTCLDACAGNTPHE